MDNGSFKNTPEGIYLALLYLKGEAEALGLERLADLIDAAALQAKSDLEEP